MNPYYFTISLRFRHPTMDLLHAAIGLDLKPSRAWRAGMPRADVSGASLEGVYAESYWAAPLLGGDKVYSGDLSLDEALRGIVAQLLPHSDLLNSISNEGRSELFIGVFASNNFCVEISVTLMQELAGLRLALGIDAYP